MYFLVFSGLFITVIYLTLIIYFIIGWLKEKEIFSAQKQFSTFVSVIIPVRNEEENIEKIANDISVQKFPQNLFEIIVVDDCSEDGTFEKIGNPDLRYGTGRQSAIGNMKIIRLEKNFAGKKNAIAKGIKHSKGELIITTDADCSVGKNWLSAIVSFYEQKKPKMIIAPVCFHNEKTFFEKIQAMEFLSLAGITGASASAGNPLMCNGANLAYEKSAFYEAGGFNGIEKTPSGDDILLMLKLKKLFPGQIKFLKSKEAIAFTNPEKNFSDFIQQRKRWVSKNRHYNDIFVTATAWIVLIYNFSILVFAALSFFNKVFAEIMLLSLSAKLLIDFLFLFLTASFFESRLLSGLWLYVPVQVIYVFYVPFIAILGLSGKFTWKGRKY